MKENTAAVIDALHEVANDNTIPKNIREKINNILSSLNQEDELSLKIDRALHELEEISEDSNLQAYTRTQVWNIVSMLESLN
jgi:uncharacterized protein (UPF0147 family)